MGERLPVMSGQVTIEIVADIMRKKDDEGYTCPTCTVFGLDDSEARSLVKSGYSLVNNGNDDEGYEVKSSAYKVRRELGQQFGYQQLGKVNVTDAPHHKRNANIYRKTIMI